jgi:HJR/Mrr/RecB family endonuclease
MGRYRKEDGLGEAVGGLIMWVALVYFIQKHLGLIWVLYIVGSFFLLFFVYSIISKIRANKEQEKKAKAPCQHGVIGAVKNTTICPTCCREMEEREKVWLAEKQRKHKEWIRQIRLPNYLKTVDPREFELIICELFKRLGYDAKATSYIGDSGIDGYLEKDGVKSVLQCKRVKGYVGEPVLRDIYGAMHASGAESAFVVTTGRVSHQARQWASGKPIRIIELPELHILIDEYFREDELMSVKDDAYY